MPVPRMPASSPPTTNVMSSGTTSFAWRETASGIFQRPLTAAEDRFDAFHRVAPTAWTDFCSSVFFDVADGPYAAAAQPDSDDVTDWAHRSLAHVLLDAPLLMATIVTSDDTKVYNYQALDSPSALQARTKLLLTVEHVQDVKQRVDELSSSYYADKERVGVELGDALVRFIFVASPGGQYALFLQTTHALIDFWALASLFEKALDALCRDLPWPSSVGDKQEAKQLSPAYLQVMKDPTPIDYHNPTQEERDQAARIMAALLQNPLGLPIQRVKEEEAAAAKADTSSMTIKHVFTPDQTAAIAKRAKEQGESVNVVIQTAHILALQAVVPVAKDNPVRTHAPSGILNVLPRTTMLDGNTPPRPTLSPAQQPFMGSLMVPYVCDIGPLLDLPDAGQKSKARKDAFWSIVSNIGSEYRKSATATGPLKEFWDKGPALWGGFVDMLPAVYAGVIPS